MENIDIKNITDITHDKIFYREERGDIVFIELAPCANSYDAVHKITSRAPGSLRCVGERFWQGSGERAYYELYTIGHTRLYLDLKQNKLKRIISKIFDFDFLSKKHQLFYSVQKRLNENGWTTLDLS